MIRKNKPNQNIVFSSKNKLPNFRVSEQGRRSQTEKNWGEQKDYNINVFINYEVLNEDIHLQRSQGGEISIKCV